MMPTSILLRRLRLVQPVAWNAACPNCTKLRALFLASTRSGPLLYCDSCAVQSIVAASGLELSDLYPPHRVEAWKLGASHLPHSARLMHEWLKNGD
jgi:hypothetical protein